MVHVVPFRKGSFLIMSIMFKDSLTSFAFPQLNKYRLSLLKIELQNLNAALCSVALFKRCQYVDKDQHRGDGGDQGGLPESG